MHIPITTYFLGKFGGDIEAFLLADVVQDGDDLVDGGCGHSDAKTTRPDGGNHFRRRVGAQNDAARRRVLLHRPAQRVLRVFRQAAFVYMNFRIHTRTYALLGICLVIYNLIY